MKKIFSRVTVMVAILAVAAVFSMASFTYADETNEYQTLRYGFLTVDYMLIDEEGNPTDQRIADSAYLWAPVGSDYQTEQKDVDGYQFVRIDGQASGKVEEDMKVVYYYKKGTEAKEMGSVKLQRILIDDNGNELRKLGSEITLLEEVPFGTKYRTSYLLEKNDSEALASNYFFVRSDSYDYGIVEEPLKIIKYYYKDANSSKTGSVVMQNFLVDNNGKKIKALSEAVVVIKDWPVGTQYGWSDLDRLGAPRAPSIKEYEYVGPFLRCGLTVFAVKDGTTTIESHYRKRTGSVQVRYLTTTTRADVVATEVFEQYYVAKDEAVGTEYTTEQKSFPGYRLLKVVGEPKGKVKSGETVITYMYEKTRNYYD